MARPKKAGRRTKAGRRIAPHDYGNDKVQARVAAYARFQDGKANQQVHDAIGRAWAAGLLDGYGVDGAAIRDAGRNYAERYWGYYPSAAGVANYEGESRKGSGWGDDQDPRGERFQALDTALRDAGRQAYDAMQSLTVDGHWFPDENPAWLDRLINSQRVDMGLPPLGYSVLATDSDRQKMRLAVSALLAIVEGKERRAA